MKRILIVDDSPIAREIIARVLKSDYELAMAESGESAISITKEQKFDLILLDLLMQGMSGFETLQNLRQNGVTTTVLIISADIQKSTKEKAMNLGASGLLNKPINPLVLTETIATLFATGTIPQ